MKSSAMLLLAGMLFGSGLAIAGMTEPTRVLGFLDIFGTWDPTLAFVMGGGVAVTLPGFAVLMRQSRPWHDVDARLVVGSALFGLGWGLAGFCPGPALAGLVTGSAAVVAFVIAMLTGMMAHDRLLKM